MGRSLVLKVLDKQNNLSQISLLAFTFFVFLLSSYVSAQIIIKEKVEINPQSLIIPDNPNLTSRSIRVEVDWDAQEEQANGHFWNANLQVNTQLTDNCDQIVGATGFIYGWPTGSSILNIQNANAYYYTLRVTLTGFYGAYQSVDVNYRFYFDDELLQSGLIEAMSGQDYNWTVTRYYERTHYVFLVDFLDFRINTYNYPVEYKSNYNLHINPGNSCSSTNVVSLTDEVNLSIIQGSQYLTFFQSQTEDTLGSSTQTILSDLNNIQLIYNQPLRDTLDTLGVIMIEGNGLVEYDSVTIKPALFELIVETDPKIIAPGDTAIVTVKRRTDYGIEEFNSEQSFDVWIIEGSNYGLLLDSLTGNSGSSLTDAVNRFRIIANDSIDVDSTKISIKVTTEEGIISTRLIRDNTKTNVNERAQTENEDKDDETILPDWFIPGEPTLLEGYGDVVVDEWCKELDECDEIEFPDIDWDDHRNGYEVTNAITGQIETLNVCENGFLSGIGFLGSGYIEFIEYDDVEICLNNETNKVQFKFGDDNEITINYVWDFCSDYIRNNGIIRASSIYNIPGVITPLCYDILLSLELSKYYPAPLRQGDYMFEDIWEMHEQEHRKLFEQSLIKYKPEYLAEMKKLEKKCEELSSKNEAIIFYTKEAKELISKFYNAGLNDENQQSIRFDQSRFPIKDPTPWRDLEDKVHKPVIKHIEELILSVKRGETGCRTR